MATEIRRAEPYRYQADLYSMGLIIWEVVQLIKFQERNNWFDYLVNDREEDLVKEYPAMVGVKELVIGLTKRKISDRIKSVDDAEKAAQCWQELMVTTTLSASVSSTSDAKLISTASYQSASVSTPRGPVSVSTLNPSFTRQSSNKPASGSTLQKGAELLTKATEEDRNGNYQEALRLYEHGVEYFLYACKYEADSDRSKELIRQKCVVYLKRAEDMKRFLKTPGLKTRNGSHTFESARYRDSDDDSEGDDISKDLEEYVTIENSNVTWSAVYGLEAAKSVLSEAALYPEKFPEMFGGKRKPWKAILLFGPTGTGKTYLAKSLSSEAKGSTLYCISASRLVSRIPGVQECESLIKMLFDVALKTRKRGIIFIDEIDLLSSSRASEAASLSRSVLRIKRELISKIQAKETEGILVIGATNMPWNLDDDLLRMFEKRIYTPLPDRATRTKMFRAALGTANHLTNDDFNELGAITDGCSGDKINYIVRIALDQPIREVQGATHFRRVTGPSTSDANLIVDDLLIPCSPNVPGSIEMTWEDVPSNKLMERPVSMRDMMLAVSKSKPIITDEDLNKKFEKFNKSFGH